MQGAPRRSARSFFVLPLVLALLALVVFPVFARAGEIPEYEIEVPTVESEVVPSHPKKHQGHQGEEPNPKAQGSKVPGNSESEGSEGTKNNGTGTTTGNGDGGSGGGNHPNGGQTQSNGGEPSKTGTSGSKGSISEQQEVATGNTNGTNASESSGGGSSPVIPILIAVVVLAAISIGVVLYRQKQSGPDGPDGRGPGQGSDGPVSSPNAS